MSLVSYANNDDSSDNDCNEANEQARRLITKEVPDTNKTSLSLPVAKKEALPEGSDQSGESRETTKPKSIGNLFSSLPAPWMSSVSWAIKSKTGKLDGKEKRAHTVKITLPVAEESDSDEESPGIKERKPISGPQPSGLSSLLPKPKHSVVVKENNPNRPVAKISNRPLIPDSLRRKQAKKVETPLRRKKQVKKDDSDDDDEEEDQGAVSFFSLEEKEESLSVEKDSGDTPDLKLETETMKSKPWNSGLINRSSTNTSNTSTITNPSFVGAEEASELEGKKYIVSLEPSYSHTESDLYSYQGHHTVSMRPPDANPYSIGQATESQVTTTENYANSGEVSADSQDYSYPMAEPYCDYSYEQQNETPQQPQHGVDWRSQVEPTTQNHSQELKKLRGKRGRGEENINIIDVNADDQVGSSSDWKSRYRLEGAEYRPQSKKKENLPSSQERRKHQITYLAFQAKEAEWELRNQWAANSQTRKQTQSKYGF